MLALPEILYDKRFENTWEWDGWKPKAKDDAPSEVKQAINEWLAEAEDDDGDGIVLK